METIRQILESPEPAMKALRANTETSAELRQPAPIADKHVNSATDPFDPCGEPLLVDMLNEAMRFMHAMCSADQPAYWLSLLGPSGTGKTMIARSIARFFHRLEGKLDENRSGPNRIFRRDGGLLDWSQCIEWMLQGDFGFMRQACEDWFLVLDDVGAEHTKLKDLSASKLFAILNARQHKFTIITANLGVEAIAEKLDPRIASRLLRHGGTVIDTTGVPDFGMRSFE